MAYVTPSTALTGDLIAAADWNKNTVDNPIALRTGAIAIASQAANDVFYASSATQMARLAAGTSGYVLTTQGSGTAPIWTAVSSTGDSDQIVIAISLFS